LRYGIIADIHGNLEALEAAIADLESRGVDRWICTGDIVGYGANPSECLARVRDLDAATVAGNHDWAVCGKLDIAYFNAYAREAVEWTRAQLSDSEISYLTQLPLTYDVTDVLTVAHSTLYRPDTFEYLLTAYDASISMRMMEVPLLVVGHSHVPVTFLLDYRDQVAFTFEPRIEVKKYKRTILNTGSVGQPRDDNPDAAFGHYDTETGFAEVIRLPYDVDTASGKIRAAGLPEILAERLHVGK